MNNSIKGEKHICSNCGAKFFDLKKALLFVQNVILKLLKNHQMLN